MPGELKSPPPKTWSTNVTSHPGVFPGVAAASMAIAENPEMAAEYTTRANLVAIITNGTAVLGLGAIGALASKPVMEGKAVLFKKIRGRECVRH